MKLMSRFMYFLVGIAVLFAGVLQFPLSRANATAAAQNVLTNCFDAYIIQDSEYTRVHGDTWTRPSNGHVYTITGHLIDSEMMGIVNWVQDMAHNWKPNPSGSLVIHHVLSLRNKTTNHFVDGIPISVVNTIVDNGVTLNQCAVDKNGASTCPSGTPNVAPNTGGYPAPFNDFSILDRTKDQLVSVGGNINIAHVAAYYQHGVATNFYGVQVLSEDQTPSTTPAAGDDTVGNALKLGTFLPTSTPAPTPPTGAQNCVTVYWDPYGRVVDARTLEPVQKLTMTLKNKDTAGSVVLTKVAGNPLFENPQGTNPAGQYTFAVPQGVYYLYPDTTAYAFPTDTALLNNALTLLKQADPDGIYVDVQNIYNVQDEPINEERPMAERRDLILARKDGQNSTVEPGIVSANSLANGVLQSISGVASHPNSIIRASAGSVALAETRADLAGNFTMNVSGAQIPSDATTIDLSVETVPLVSGITKSVSKKPFSIPLKPLNLVGLAYSAEGIVAPNSLIQIVVPALGDKVVLSASADQDGFVFIPQQNLPLLDYVIRVKDPDNTRTLMTLTTKQFQRINKPYYDTTHTSLFAFNSNTTPKKPDSQTLAAIATASAPYARNFQATPMVSVTPAATSPAEQTATDSMLTMFLMTLAVIVILAGVVFLVFKLKKPGNPFNASQIPLA